MLLLKDEKLTTTYNVEMTLSAVLGNKQTAVSGPYAVVQLDVLVSVHQLDMTELLLSFSSFKASVYCIF